jgi:hypothetical protein
MACSSVYIILPVSGKPPSPKQNKNPLTVLMRSDDTVTVTTTAEATTPKPHSNKPLRLATCNPNLQSVSRSPHFSPLPIPVPVPVTYPLAQTPITSNH